MPQPNDKRPRIPDADPEWFDTREPWEKGFGYPPVPRWMKALMFIVCVAVAAAVMAYAVAA